LKIVENVLRPALSCYQCTNGWYICAKITKCIHPISCAW